MISASPALPGVLSGLLVLLALLAAYGWRQSRLLRRQLETLAAQQQQERSASQQQSRVEAAAEERERIYADLHDDIGAKLLSLVYQAEQPAQADLARSILQESVMWSHARADNRAACWNC